MSEYSNSKIDLCASVVITLFDPQSRREISQSKGSVFSSQSFKYIPKEAIQELIVDGGIMQNCGGFTVTDPRMAPFLSSRSGSIDEIIGFPISLTNRLMAEIIHDAPEI